MTKYKYVIIECISFEFLIQVLVAFSDLCLEFFKTCGWFHHIKCINNRCVVNLMNAIIEECIINKLDGLM